MRSTKPVPASGAKLTKSSMKKLMMLPGPENVVAPFVSITLKARCPFTKALKRPLAFRVTRPCGRIHRTRFMEFLTGGQSIHSLTRAEMSGGNNNPSFAIADRLALMVNCVGPSIGKSAGFVPFSILSTYFAAP